MSSPDHKRARASTVMASDSTTATSPIGISYLTPEILSQVFTLIDSPYKSLKTVRCVCKAWKAITEDSKFDEDLWRTRKDGKGVMLADQLMKEGIEKLVLHPCLENSSYACGEADDFELYSVKKRDSIGFAEAGILGETVTNPPIKDLKIAPEGFVAMTLTSDVGVTVEQTIKAIGSFYTESLTDCGADCGEVRCLCSHYDEEDAAEEFGFGTMRYFRGGHPFAEGWELLATKNGVPALKVTSWGS